MKNLQLLKHKKHQATRLVKSFQKDNEGVAAVEFAFLAPIMLLLYIGTLEISSAVTANKKLSRGTYTVSDLISQHKSQDNCINSGDISDIVKIADDILYPYPHGLKISISGIKIENDTNKVVWSKAYNGGVTHPTNQIYSAIPAEVNKLDGYLIATKIRMDYKPYFGFAGSDGNGFLSFDNAALPMEKVIYARPRSGQQLDVC
ncbi:MAG: TadE/TadG family type IV pilus assembly protein [Nitratireductor sp.]